MFACIPARTQVDTPLGPKPIEDFLAGDTVIGFTGKPVRILQKHAYLEDPQTQFLQVSFEGGSTLALCGMHRIAGVRAQSIQVGQTIAHRKVVRIERSAGYTQSFDLLTEDPGYQIQGIPVNSMIAEMQETAVSRLRTVRP